MVLDVGDISGSTFVSALQKVIGGEVTEVCHYLSSVRILYIKAQTQDPMEQVPVPVCNRSDKTGQTSAG